MSNLWHLDFNVLQKPDKDFYKTIQSNAKFKSLEQVIRTKVGINNFYNFSIAFKSSIIMRDIVMNSMFVSGWARSSQVLNNTDSKFAGYRFLTKSANETNEWVAKMEKLEAAGHSMDNMRCLITLDMITDYAINIDLLHLIYLGVVLNFVANNLDETHKDLFEECMYFYSKIEDLLNADFDIDLSDFYDMLYDALRDFNVCLFGRSKASLDEITKERVYQLDVTYSVVGQIFRHRTLVKHYRTNNYHAFVNEAQLLTSKCNYKDIGVHYEISQLIQEITLNANNIYQLCQGSIVPIEISGTTGAIYKAFCQRACYINDTPHFKDAFDAFLKDNPDLKLIPPCKFNGGNCYVGYVNESRLKGEEKTQIVCPVWAKSNCNTETFKNSLDTSKSQWYLNNIEMWKAALGGHND